MGLSLYNTATHSKDSFEPLVADTVGMYVCGPTVYDLAHIGNARPAVVFDVLYRLLKRQYKNVTYVRNITDVDDKIIDAAKRNDETIESVTARTAKAYHEDMAELGAMPPDIEPRATAHLPQMIETIQELIGLGKAYEAEGHVLFAVAEYADYGKLSRRNRDEMLAGARVEVAPYKRDGADFVLWKPSTEEQPGWDSPWGRGRPGWHIECSVMSNQYLGKTFDIHGGGQDLIFPHHENEAAQSACVHDGAPLARYWVHNGFITIDGEKMAKSVGNVRSVRQLLERHRGETIRLAMLGTHYRKGLDWTDQALQLADKALDKWYEAVKVVDVDAGSGSDIDSDVDAALNDDLNTPQAIAALHALASKAWAGNAQAAVNLRVSAQLLGLLGQESESWFHNQVGVTLDETKIDALVEARNAARAAKDFAEADRIRGELEAAGIALEDSAGQTYWKRSG
jgi:cysteinyl-tRNA synthetase